MVLLNVIISILVIAVTGMLMIMQNLKADATRGDSVKKLRFADI